MHALEAEQLLDVELGQKPAGALHLHAVVKEPHLNGVALQAVIAVGDGIEQGLLPGEAGV